MMLGGCGSLFFIVDETVQGMTGSLGVLLARVRA